MQKGRLKSRPFFSRAQHWRLRAKSFIQRSTNKCRGTDEVPEQLKSPFVVGAGNDAGNT
jgi:hypothetical protein